MLLVFSSGVLLSCPLLRRLHPKIETKSINRPSHSDSKNASKDGLNPKLKKYMYVRTISNPSFQQNYERPNLFFRKWSLKARHFTAGTDFQSYLKNTCVNEFPWGMCMKLPKQLRICIGMTATF